MPTNTNWRKGSGEFNGDGATDLALTGVPGWITVAFALGTGDGNFNPANLPVDAFPNWAANAYSAIAGRFNTSGFTDIVLSGGNGFQTTPVLFTQK